MRVASIVEGDGEVSALPVLLRRLGEWKTPDVYTDVVTPIRVRRDRFLNREDEFRRHLLLAAGKCGEDGWILILLDADDACPVALAGNILERAKAYIPHRRLSVVLANREYEAWFIAAAASLRDQRGFTFDSANSIDAESIRDAKGWMREHMSSGIYREMTDQSAFTARIDLQEALDRSRSFRKLCAEWVKWSK